MPNRRGTMSAEYYSKKSTETVGYMQVGPSCCKDCGKEGMHMKAHVCKNLLIEEEHVSDMSHSNNNGTCSTEPSWQEKEREAWNKFSDMATDQDDGRIIGFTYGDVSDYWIKRISQTEERINVKWREEIKNIIYINQNAPVTDGIESSEEQWREREIENNILKTLLTKMEK